MASATDALLLQINPTRFPAPKRHAPLIDKFKQRQFSFSSPLRQSRLFPPFPPSSVKLWSSKSPTISCAYVSGPPIVSEPDPKVNESEATSEEEQPPKLINLGLLWSLLLKHKLKLGVSFLTLVGCTTCTLSMPIFSGRFFEVLIGARPDPLWRLLSKVGILYSLEPLFTVIFVVNMNTVWEKVMSTLRAHIFRRVLIQKVEFFDRYKVGELSALLTSDLGSLKDIVSENISRDRGFRALSEASHSILEQKLLGPYAYYLL